MDWVSPAVLVASIGGIASAVASLLSQYIVSKSHRHVHRAHVELGEPDGSVTRIELKSGDIESAERLIREFVRISDATAAADSEASAGAHPDDPSRTRGGADG